MTETFNLAKNSPVSVNSRVMQQGNQDNGTVINGEDLTQMLDKQILICSGDVVFFEHVTDSIVNYVYGQLSDGRVSILQVLSQYVTDLRVQYCDRCNELY